MILLTQEVKLKLQELVKVHKAANLIYPRFADYDSNEGAEPSECDILNVADELVKLLPPEVTDGVIDNETPPTVKVD